MNSRCARSPCWRRNGQGFALPLNTIFTKAGKKGDRVITLKNAAQHHPGIEILIGADNVGGNEVGRIQSIKGNEITLVLGCR